jgi:hypothetical protein
MYVPTKADGAIAGILIALTWNVLYAIVALILFKPEKTDSTDIELLQKKQLQAIKEILDAERKLQDARMTGWHEKIRASAAAAKNRRLQMENP